MRSNGRSDDVGHHELIKGTEPTGERLIGSVAVGERVLAYDEATGETDYYAVTTAWSHADVVLVTTPEHLFDDDGKC